MQLEIHTDGGKIGMRFNILIREDATNQEIKLAEALQTLFKNASEKAAKMSGIKVETMYEAHWK